MRVAPVIDPARSCEMPHYPAVSRRLGEQGAVVLRFLVSPDGSVQKGEIRNSSGFELLDQAALSSLSNCRFTPATIDGKPDPQPAWALMRYVWKLQEGEGAPPAGERHWYTLAANKDAMFVADEYSASAKDGVISFIESQIFYALQTVKEIGDTPVRRFDSLAQIDCTKKAWRMTSLAFINDTNQVITSVAPNEEQQWMPIEADSAQDGAFKFFCLGQYDKRMARKDSDIYLVQQAYLNAAKGFQ